MSLKIHFLHSPIYISFQKILMQWENSKGNASINIFRLWKLATKDFGTKAWWLTIVGCCIMKIQTMFIKENHILNASKILYCVYSFFTSMFNDFDDVNCSLQFIAYVLSKCMMYIFVIKCNLFAWIVFYLSQIFIK